MVVGLTHDVGLQSFDGQALEWCLRGFPSLDWGWLFDWVDDWVLGW